MVLFTMIALIIMIALLSMIIDKLPYKFRLKINELTQNLSISWIALALSLFGTGTKFIQNSFHSELLVWFGMVLVVLSGPFIGKTVGSGARQIIEVNPRFLAGLGVISILGSIIGLLINWSLILTSPLLNIANPLFFLALGVEFVYFGIKWNKRNRINRHMVRVYDNHVLPKINF